MFEPSTKTFADELCHRVTRRQATIQPKCAQDWAYGQYTETAAAAAAAAAATLLATIRSNKHSPTDYDTTVGSNAVATKYDEAIQRQISIARRGWIDWLALVIG